MLILMNLKFLNVFLHFYIKLKLDAAIKHKFLDVTLQAPNHINEPTRNNSNNKFGLFITILVDKFTVNETITKMLSQDRNCLRNSCKVSGKEN